MSAGLLYAWGFAGGLAAALLVYVVPTAAHLAVTDEPPLSRRRIGSMAFLIVALAATAGLVPLIPDSVTRGQAISLGLASQAILKGVISGVRDALPPPGAG